MVMLKKFVPVSVANNHQVYCKTLKSGDNGEFFDESFYLPFYISLFGIHLPEYDWIVPGHTAPIESTHYYVLDTKAHLKPAYFKPENGTYRRVHLEMSNDFQKSGVYYEYNEDRSSYTERKSEKRIQSDRLKIMKDICASRTHYSRVSFDVVHEIKENFLVILRDPVTKMEFPCDRRICY
jgi:hypothetical protein